MAVALALFVAAVQWINSAHVNIGNWSKGVPSNPASYIPLAAVIVLLILPEVKVELPGVRLELQHQREDIQRVAGQVQAIQNSLVQVAPSRSLAIASGASTADLVQALAEEPVDYSHGGDSKPGLYVRPEPSRIPSFLRRDHVRYMQALRQERETGNDQATWSELSEREAARESGRPMVAFRPIPGGASDREQHASGYTTNWLGQSVPRARHGLR
jgi:hypothetical protein